MFRVGPSMKHDEQSALTSKVRYQQAEETIDDDEGIDDERTEDTITDELERLLLDTICELLPPTIPHGAGCAAHVEREIQLL